MYEFVRGPVVWLAFAVFIGGGILRFVLMALALRNEKAVYPTLSAKFGARSLLHWLVPYASRSSRLHPWFTAISYGFHVTLLLTPLFVMGHAVLWQESWGVSWWSLPPVVADVLTLFVIIGALFFALRRLTEPQVRHVSTWADFALLLLVASPFVTGFVMHQQWFEARTILVIHIVSGALWLMAIPFTRLSHMLWFAFTRIFMGSEFGSVRNARDY